MNNYSVKEACFDEVFDSQKNYKVLMEGMSRPGKIFKLHQHGFERYPDSFNPWFMTVLKTLGDNNVSFSLSKLSNDAFKDYIRINTGMVLTSYETADYAIFEGKIFDESFTGLKPGTLEFPEDSATAVISVIKISDSFSDLASKDSIRIYMSGPGIKDVNCVQITGLDRRYAIGALEMNEVFPLGVDLIFVDMEGNLTCMARTTKAEVK